MATVEDIYRKFPDVQLVGGKFIARIDEKNVEIGGFAIPDGAFNFTEKGAELIEITPDAPKVKAKKSGGDASDSNVPDDL